MDFKDLQERAIEIRNKYSDLEKQTIGRSWTNQELMEGFVGDVGDLMKLVMAKEGVRKRENINQKLSHELSDCLWSVLVLASRYNINLEEEFLKTMDQLNDRISKESNE